MTAAEDIRNNLTTQLITLALHKEKITFPGAAAGFSGVACITIFLMILSKYDMLLFVKMPCFFLMILSKYTVLCPLSLQLYNQ